VASPLDGAVPELPRSGFVHIADSAGWFSGKYGDQSGWKNVPELSLAFRALLAPFKNGIE